ncbi:MAG: L,D-transpeptidase family protein [Alphaproteobacteria bacterium]|nr:L,D-transpeptidase family protein [Alphaproteobacteria bacterium]
MNTRKMIVGCTVAALTLTLSVGVVLPTAGPAQAQQRTSLFDIIFNNKSRRERVHRQRLEEQRRKAQRAAKAPVVRVSSPRIYTYKPDKMKTFDLSSLSRVEIASADPYLPQLGSSAFDESRRFLDGVKIRTADEVGAAIIEYYSANPDFVWVDGTAANDNARAAIAEMAKADEFGLSPSDYMVDIPSDGFDMTDMANRQRQLMMFEMNMSAKALSYVLDATRGRIDPNRLSGYHDFKRKEVDLEAALGNLAATPDAGVYLAGSNPGNRQFKALKDELADLRAAEENELIVIAKGTFLKPGAKNPEVANVVAAIRKRGSDKLLVDHGITLYEYELSGGLDYTPELVAMVKDFQRENKLAADGIVGKMTIAKLTDLSNADKMDKLVLAMERLRWLPRNLGTKHVFINQPAFRATFIKDDKENISMRVVVGKKSNQTNFFHDEIETVEYNPYWGVPRSIIINEMLPKLRADPSYLDRLGYELTNRRGQRVSSRNVNWYAVGTNVPVDVRQPPGRKNALGELKILFPNKHAIYMHDTPSKSLFDRDARAFSHGCIRLHDPRGMAAAVLGSSREHIAAQIAQGRNMAEPVPGKIPVYVSYFTAWPKEDGSVGYYSDMYGRDKRLGMAIERTQEVRGAQG